MNLSVAQFLSATNAGRLAAGACSQAMGERIHDARAVMTQTELSTAITWLLAQPEPVVGTALVLGVIVTTQEDKDSWHRDMDRAIQALRGIAELCTLDAGALVNAVQ